MKRIAQLVFRHILWNVPDLNRGSMIYRYIKLIMKEGSLQANIVLHPIHHPRRVHRSRGSQQRGLRKESHCQAPDFARSFLFEARGLYLLLLHHWFRSQDDADVGVIVFVPVKQANLP